MSETPIAAVLERPSTRATTSFIAGISGVVGAVGSGCCCCCLPLLWAGPFAWYLGGRELADIGAGRAPSAGRERAAIGRVLGIVATAFLVLSLLAAVLAISLFGVGSILEWLAEARAKISGS